MERAATVVRQTKETNIELTLGLDGGEIKEGGVADLMIADLDEEWTIDPAKFVSKGKNNPFGGMKLFGAVKYTIVDGEIKYNA